MLVFSPVTHNNSWGGRELGWVFLGCGMVFCCFWFCLVLCFVLFCFWVCLVVFFFWTGTLSTLVDHLKDIGQGNTLCPMLSGRFASMAHTLQNAVSELIFVMITHWCSNYTVFWLPALSYKQPGGRTFICICKESIAGNINKSYHLGAVTYTLFNL